MNLIFVVGPARSGTSAMVGVLGQMGAATPAPTVAGKYNPRYYENLLVNALSEAIHPWDKVTIKNRNPHLWQAMAEYIAMITHAGRNTQNLVLKSPVFPFILPELDKVVGMLKTVPNMEVTPHWVRVHRDIQATALSMQHFTESSGTVEHFKHLAHVAHSVADDHLEGRETVYHFDYEKLVEDWRPVARALSNISGLNMPEDGGIDPALNHYDEVGGYAAEAYG